MSQPLLSIITVTFNNLEGLQATVNSLQSQTTRDFEWIVIDGDSTDGSQAYLAQHRELCTTLVSEPDRGIYDAMNKGIDRARGRYVQFLNAGDIFFEETSLEQLLPKLTGEVLLYGDARLVWRERQVLKRYPRKLSFSYLCVDSLCHQAMFWRRDWFETTGNYEFSEPIFADLKHLLQSFLHPAFSSQHLQQTIVDFDMYGVSANASLPYIRRAAWVFQWGGLPRWLWFTLIWLLYKPFYRRQQRKDPGWTGPWK